MVSACVGSKVVGHGLAGTLDCGETAAEDVTRVDAQLPWHAQGCQLGAWGCRVGAQGCNHSPEADARCTEGGGEEAAARGVVEPAAVRSDRRAAAHLHGGIVSMVSRAKVSKQASKGKSRATEFWHVNLLACRSKYTVAAVVQE